MSGDGCLNCGVGTDSRYCSVSCNNAHYRSLNKERRKTLLKIWRHRNRQQIEATCHTCGIKFTSTRKISKDCSIECYNKRRVIDRKNRSDDRLLRDKQLARKRYEKMRSDTTRKLKADLRSRLNRAINGKFKSGSAIQDLGCSIDQLQIYLESRFLPGMTWKNRGRDGWHIDHIVPLSKFDLSDSDQLKQACHYTNLQPMWAVDNIRKGGA